MRRRTRRLVSGALAGFVLAAVMAGGGGTAVAAEQATAMVRIAHFVPDLSYVDVYAVSLGRTRVMPNVFYKDISGYVRLPAGAFTFEVRSAGAPNDTTPLVSVAGREAPGGAYTVASVGHKGDLRGVLVRDDLTAAAPGRARVRVLNVADGLGPVQVDLAGTGVRFARPGFAAPSRYASVQAGRYRVNVRRPGGTVLVKGSLRVQAGAVTTLALVGGSGKARELVPVQDAMGMGRMPSGGIATGGGGTAPGQAPRVPIALAAAGLALTGALALRKSARDRSVTLA